MLLRVESDGVQNALFIILQQDTSGDVIRGVGFKDAWLIVVVVLEDGRADKGGFEGLKG